MSVLFSRTFPVILTTCETDYKQQSRGRSQVGPLTPCNQQPSLLPMTVTVGVFEAKTRLSELLETVQRGEEVIITKRGLPIATLRPIENRADRAQSAIDALRAIGARTKPGPDGIHDLIEDGRRYP